MSSTEADAAVAVDRWLAELQGSVSGPGLAVDGKRPVWHHILVSFMSHLALHSAVWTRSRAPCRPILQVCMSMLSISSMIGFLQSNHLLLSMPWTLTLAHPASL